MFSGNDCRDNGRTYLGNSDAIYTYSSDEFSNIPYGCSIKNGEIYHNSKQISAPYANTEYELLCFTGG
jgi:hypothetical protein